MQGESKTGSHMVPWDQRRQGIFQDFDQDENRGGGRLRIDHGDQGNIMEILYRCIIVILR